MTAPVNDNFTSATTLTGTSGAEPFTNVDATLESGEPDNDLGSYGAHILGQSVWFAYTPAADGSLHLLTSSLSGDDDTTLEVFTGSAITALTLVASADDVVGSYAELTVAVTGGVPLHIRIDSWTYVGHPVVDGTLDWDFTPTPPSPPGNDDFANRTVLDLSAGGVEVPFDLTGATLESGEQHTTGIAGAMAGSVWYEVTIPADNYVLFTALTPAYNPDVEIVRFRGTATLAGMLYRSTEDATHRTAFLLTGGLTYFIKLQSATALESGTLRVQPFGWSDWIMPEPVQQGGARTFTRLNGSNTDGSTTETPFSAAWANAVDGTVVTSNQVSGSTLGSGLPLGTVIDKDSLGGYFASINLGVLAVEFGGTVGPLYAPNWPTDPSGLAPSLVSGLDYEQDPISFDSIQWDSGTASLVNDDGMVGFTAAAHTSTAGDDARTLDFYLNPVAPPGVYTDIPAWPALPNSGDDTLTLSYTPPSTRSVSGGSADAPYDLYSHLAGTRVALLVSPDPTEPALGAITTPGGAVMAVADVTVTATLPVQYPRYKLYGPLPAASTVRPPLRQWPRDDGLRRIPARQGVAGPTSRQGSLRRGPRGTYT